MFGLLDCIPSVCPICSALLLFQFVCGHLSSLCEGKDISSWKGFLVKLVQLCVVEVLFSYPVSGKPSAGLIAVFVQQGRTRLKGLFLFPDVSTQIKKYLKVCKYC